LTELIELVEETGVDPRNLNIEITESVFSDNYHEINEKLDKIKLMGMKIAIDDFGTGYSSLARERELNVNCLKIDKYFIDKLTRINPKDAITGDVISMAHKLGHYVVAEGVEHEMQKKYLLEHSCDMMQGYLFSKPVDKEVAIDMLKNCKKSIL
jgi:EAL domain-containing protein (putative c-di-GMP-specific phosphodiesterase class I)